jgi:transglutaminase-like putative cysteine protease
MHIRVKHQTIYRYAEPVKAAVQRLLLTPRNFNGQHVRRWRIDVDRNCRLHQSEDAFGNIVHSFSVDGPFDSLSTLVEGDVETFDTAGVVRGAIERFPPELYLRETALTEPSDALRNFAQDATRRETTPLAKMHALMGALHETIAFNTDVTHSSTTAAEAFSHKSGVCQDFAHVFIAGARGFEIPARYVSGYFRRGDGDDDQTAGHAWAEAYVGEFGWIGFDPANCQCPTDAYLRVAAALDYLGAAPIRGARTGGAGEAMEVKVHVDMARSLTQSQTQS